MNEIKIFNNPQFGEIRTATTESGEPLFCLADVCKILDIKNVADCKSRLNEKGIATADTLTSGGVQKMIYINESNLYKTVFQSRKQEAEQFTDWVTSEVLPAIRKHGGYLTAKKIEEVLLTPDTIIQLATALKDERAARELAQKQLRQQAGIVKYASEVLSSGTGHTSTVIASELNMSAYTLNKLLVKAHLLRKTGKHGEYSLCASHQGRGYVITETHKYIREDETTGTRIEIRFTEAGRMKIREIFKRALAASVLIERKGRYFINHSWKEDEKAA